MKKIHILTDDKLQKLIEERSRQIEAEKSRKLQKEVIEKEALLASLQSQINPHFLYNALEGIRGQAILEGSEVIAEIARALSRFFRYSISSRENITTLSEELKNMQDYLKIQQFRFGSRFHVEIEYEEEDYEVMQAILPKMTLQPIVENAIAHGFEHTTKDAAICTRIVRTEKNVNITVSDNGVGMNAAVLKKLNEKIRSGEIEQSRGGSHNGIAMPNVNRRLQLLFGEEYGIHISSIEGMGTDVEIHIPFCTERKRAVTGESV